MPIPESFLEELNQRTDIVDLVGDYVSLQKKGNKYWGLCPFHSEKTPSFSVTPERQMYYCYGCHKGGGAVNFVMELEGLGFADAVEQLAGRVGLRVPETAPGDESYRKKRDRLLELNRRAARWFHANLSLPAGGEGADYFRRRGLTGNTITRFGLGVAPDGWDNLIGAMAELGYEKSDLLEAGLAVQNDQGRVYDRFRNRVIFPIIDVRGGVIGFGGRVLDESKPKYLNSPDTLVYNKSRNFFALNLARKSRQGHLILTEGYMDTIALHQAGFDCAVASLGTSLTEDHVKLLSNYTKEVIVAYDADEAGVSAAQRAIRLLEKTGLAVRVLRVPGGQDPDEYIRDHGAVAFSALLEKSSDRVDYQLNRLREKYDLQRSDQKVAYLRDAAKLVAGLDSPVEREIYGRQAAESAELSYAAMEEEVGRLRSRNARKQRKNEERRAMAPAQALQPPERSLRYRDISSARAEEGVIRLLLKDDGFFRQADDLTPEQFTSPVWGKVFSLLRQRWEQGEHCSAAFLSSRLTAEEMSLLAGIQEQPESVANGSKAMSDYVRTIRRQRGADSDDALMTFRNSKLENGGVF